MLTFYALTGGVAKYIELFIDQKKYTCREMLDFIFMPDSYFLSEGKNLLVEEFGKDYGSYFSILTLIAQGQNKRNEIVSALSGKEISGYLRNLSEEYDLISKRQPLFENSQNKNVHYAINDQFLRFWFRFIYKYIHIIEAEGYERLKMIVHQELPTFLGLSLESYYTEKLKERGIFTRIGYWHDRKGNNVIDIIAADELEKTVKFIEVKNNEHNIDLSILQAKADAFLQTTGAFKSFAYHFTGLSTQDM